jgi:hypothetical protein
MDVLAHLPPRDQIAAAIETMVAVLDLLDGDPDLELNGDELDGSSHAEDEFWPHSSWQSHAGCPVSDPAEDDDPGGTDLDHGELGDCHGLAC